MDLGTLEQRDGTQVIRFERHLRHPIERVWEAITDPAEAIGWWGRVERDLRVGGAFTVTWLNTRDHEGNQVDEPFAMHAQITALDAPTLLEMSSEEHGTLRFELAATHDGTFMRFSATGEIPETIRVPALAGWHTHLDALETVLDGGEVDLVNLPQFDANLARY